MGLGPNEAGVQYCVFKNDFDSSWNYLKTLTSLLHKALVMKQQ